MQELLVQKEVALAVQGRLTVLSVNAKLSVAVLDTVMTASLPHRQRYGRSAVSLTVMRPNVAVPDEEARAHIRAINQRGDSAASSWVVLDAGGFWAASMRGVLAGMSLVSTAAPQATSTVKHALEQMGPLLDADTGSAAVLEPWIEDFRRRHLAL